MTTLLSLIQQLREDRLSEPTPGFWSDETLRRYIDTAVRDIARQTKCFTVEGSVSIVAGTQTYDLPTNLCAVIEPCTYTPTGSSLKYPLEAVDYAYARHAWGVNSAISTGVPLQFATRDYPSPAVDALQLLLFPIPSQAGTLHIQYAKIPTALASDGSDDASDVDLPTGWEDVALDYAEYRAWSKSRSPDAAPRAATALQAYRDNLGALNVTSARWSTQGGRVQFDQFWPVNGEW